MIRILKLPLTSAGHNVHDLLAIEVLSVAWQGVQLVAWVEGYCDDEGKPYPAPSTDEALELSDEEQADEINRIIDEVRAEKRAVLLTDSTAVTETDVSIR